MKNEKLQFTDNLQNYISLAKEIEHHIKVIKETYSHIKFYKDLHSKIKRLHLYLLENHTCIASIDPFAKLAKDSLFKAEQDALLLVNSYDFMADRIRHLLLDDINKHLTSSYKGLYKSEEIIKQYNY